MRNSILVGLLAISLGTNIALAERQPLMRDALQNLKQASASLQKAAHDKGGHRAKALELTKAAIEQVEKGIAFDNKH